MLPFSDFFESLLSGIMPRRRYSAVAQRYTAETLTRLITIQGGNNCLSLMAYRDREVRYTLRALLYEHDRRSAGICAALLKPVIDNEMLEQKVLERVQPLLCAVPPVFKPDNPLDLVLGQQSAPYVKNLLVWKKPVQKQRGLPKSVRIKNREETMQITQKIPEDAVCFVLDDTVTTGAALAEAQRVLRNAGARAVVPIALARTR